MSVENRDVAERRSADAFARSGWADPRADYRAMLRRLREQSATLFSSAVADYEDAVVGRLSDAEADPVAAWLAYGVRLAGWAAGGRTVRIDAEGRRSDTTGGFDTPSLLLQLPAEESGRAMVVAAPREPSAAQAATIALLVDGRLAL